MEVMEKKEGETTDYLTWRRREGGEVALRRPERRREMLCFGYFRSFDIVRV